MNDANAPAFWRSLDERAGSPEFEAFARAEFPFEAPERLDPVSRRRFLQIMGASAALAGMTACRWPEEKIVPFAKRPQGRLPGARQSFATAFDLGGSAQGLLVTSVDGRPVKVEGNPDHPINQGAADGFAQAVILELYDPDRSKTPRLQTGEKKRADKTWADFETDFAARVRAARDRQGQGFFVLCEANSSPTLAAQQAALLAQMPQARWLEYEAVSRDQELWGAGDAFEHGHGHVRALYDLSQVRVGVTLDEDLLLGHPAALKHTRDFTRARKPDSGDFSRWYAVESAWTLSGTRADHRLALRSSRIASVLAKIAVGLMRKDVRFPDDRENVLPKLAEQAPTSPVIDAIIEDLAAHRGASLIAVGPRQAPRVHALAGAINGALGNVGKTLHYTTPPAIDGLRPTHFEALTSLIEALNAGLVDSLLILGGNPVATAPGDARFADALKKAKWSAHLSLFDDETSQVCAWHLPRAHFLESWGDARAWDGTPSVIQPLIEPLWGGKTPVELLQTVIGGAIEKGHDVVRSHWRTTFLADRDFESAWRRVLHDGLFSDYVVSTFDFTKISHRPEMFLGDLVKDAGDGADFEVTFHADPSVYDGRFANNAWLQELPDPFTKLTWDNAALVAPADASALGVKTGDLVMITRGETGLTLPAFVMPGQAAGSIALFLGYGREGAGSVGTGVGFAVETLRTLAQPFIAAGVKVAKVGGRHKIATTQDHHAISALAQGELQHRAPTLAREGTLDEFRKDPNFAHHHDHHPPLISLWKDIEFDGHRWAMSVDLNACTGCSACVIACQSENNVPVVGKDEVDRGREMHWLRIDRYFLGEPDAPAVSVQPVACQHCENAPCEQVCPVGATTHSEEGLNDMVYNRCVGTRYCANNCPYKVRRFNWFWNHHGPAHPRSKQNLEPVEHLVFNPDVTVRSRGVMEKCSFCVQRIQAVKIPHENAQTAIRDGEIVPACAQTCPAQAIVFGDLADPNSAVSKKHKDARAYAMLGELNDRPRTRYLARLRNPAPGLDVPKDQH